MPNPPPDPEPREEHLARLKQRHRERAQRWQSLQKRIERQERLTADLAPVRAELDRVLAAGRGLEDPEPSLRRAPGIRLARPRGAGRPRAQATRSSARSGDSPSDDDGPLDASRPRLELAPPPRARLAFAALSADERGEVVA